jgi:2-oxoglutarate/2-oxoacid ferredoxin oxidoreductase subunit alpha
MATEDTPSPKAVVPEGLEPIINDFAIVVATPNGTGSQTSNMAIIRALYKMGIPVNGKNIFPSNIQGLPTWYHIRVSKDGYIARRETSEILVAFNPDSVMQDVQNLPPGGVCIYNENMRGLPERDDITLYPLPITKMLKEVGATGNFKERYTNMFYVGAVAALLGMDLAAIDQALDIHFGRRRKLVEMNMAVIQKMHDWVLENLEKKDPYLVEPMDKTAGQIIITGNEAAGLGSVFGGVTVCAWYPITPSTSMVDALNDYLPKLRQDPETGEPTYAVIQAEDELAAAGMVLGAGWMGGRALTSTSGPGISLMAEFIGLGYFAELPGVFWDIQRVGPSTGLPTRTGQGDVQFAYTLGHGDARHPVLLPSSVAECFEFGTTSLNLADHLQTPIFVLSDLDLGMNNWMSEPFEYPTEPITRGKVLTAEDVETKGFKRFVDYDGDGIGYRTLPGTKHPKAAYFTRGTGHNAAAVYSERPEDWVENMARLTRKFETARNLVPGPVVDHGGGGDGSGSRYGIIAYGTTRYAIDEARDRLAAQGIQTSFLRIRALPVNGDVRQFVEQFDRVYVIEMNRDGQMHQILQTEMPEFATRLRSIAYMDGMPLTARWVVDQLQEREGK